MKNVVLIGMPGCGKSTCGVLIAKALCMDFFDTDLMIQKNEKMSLQEIINQKGNAYFGNAEERAICSFDFQGAVVATGGSVVYSERAMAHLKQNALVVYLKISFSTMKSRISNMESRGILLRNGETLEDMFCERQPLYEKYADLTVECDHMDIEKTVAKILLAGQTMRG
ncbi:MAG: shikimate kinase [Clostridia bacterium]|nr:shikimate kinase [Clostridia bacterium]